MNEMFISRFRKMLTPRWLMFPPSNPSEPGWRSLFLARTMASPSVAGIAFLATVTSAAIGTFKPDVQWHKAVYCLVPMSWLFAYVLNEKPHYRLNIRYPCGRLVFPALVVTFYGNLAASFVLGGVPVLHETNETIQYYADSHGQLTPLSAFEFYLLVASLSATMVLLLAHCILDHRWKYLHAAHTQA